MQQLLLIGVGGACGAMLRYLSITAAIHIWDKSFPLGTLLVNILGSLLLGFCWIWLQSKTTLSADLKLAITSGLLGGFTTFSTFSLENLQMLQAGQWLHAAAYSLGSVCVCILAAGAGAALAKAIVP